MTGFRVSKLGQWGLDGAVEGWRPDLMTFGKVMGGGFPAAAFGGRADVMSRLAPEGPVYQAGTLSGNPIATTAGLATLRLATDEVYAHIGAAADTIKTAASDALSKAGVAHVVQSTGTMFSVFFSRGDVAGVRDFEDASAHRRDGVRRLLPRHARRRGLPPAVGVRGVVPVLRPRRPRRADRARRPARRRRAAAAARAQETTISEPDPRHDRPPAAPRRGAQPRGHPLRPPRRLPPLRARQPDGASGSPRASATATSCTCGSRRWSARRRPRVRWPRRAASRSSPTSGSSSRPTSSRA